VSNAVVVGEGRRYLTAVLVLDPLNAPVWATARGLAGDAPTLAAAPELATELAAMVEDVNASLSRVEQVKRFAVVPQYWAPDSEELTPTMKVRRAAVVSKYADLVESLYS
jgi:long-subunit acyl-CoA synthetase (AMP-forming)